MPRLAPSILFLALLATSLGAGAASAQFELTWDQCPGSFSARSNKAFACQDDLAQPMKMVLALTPPTALPRFAGFEAWIEISSSEPKLPDWWAIGTGDCREGALSASLAAIGVLGQCQNPWSGDNTGGGWFVDPDSPPGRTLYRIAFARASSVAINPGTRYYGATLQLEAAHASGSDGTRCPGCTAEVCIAVTKVEFDQLADPNRTNDDPDAYIATRSTQPCVVTFNARDPNANPCGATNRSTTWGRIKTTYR
jgi:hypothetical protein